jgi:FdrA protein
MQVSRTLASVDGVSAAQVAMATSLNLDVLRGMGFEPPDGAGPNDLVLALRAVDDDAIERARARLERALTRAPGGGGGDVGFGSAPPPRTVGAAARRSPGADLAVVSVPGAHAFTEAMDALEWGLSVMLLSDNVPLEQEIRLKDEAARRGLHVRWPGKRLGPASWPKSTGCARRPSPRRVRPADPAGRHHRRRRHAAPVRRTS